MSWENETTQLKIPSIAEIERNFDSIRSHLNLTPVIQWTGEHKDRLLGKTSQVYIKLELFQVAGSFKPRGGLTVASRLSPDALSRGLVTVSAGNHGISAAYLAKQLKTHAKIFLPRSANHYRVEKIKSFGAEVIICATINEAFEAARLSEADEKRFFFHPFEGYGSTLGNASAALELTQQMPAPDQVLVPVGGGGFCSGISAYLKQAPSTKHTIITGVEPTGAAGMTKSIAAQSCLKIDQVNTIADSLGSPVTLPYSYHVCNQFVDHMKTVTDEDLVNAMKVIHSEFSLTVEPACAAAFSLLLKHPDQFRDQVTGLFFCGSNIDLESWLTLIGKSGN